MSKPGNTKRGSATRLKPNIGDQAQPEDFKFGGGGVESEPGTFVLPDGKPIDHAVQPPRGCKGDLVAVRPCDRTACRYHLWADDERPGRPHDPGARPPVKLRVIGSSCMWDEVAANPDGMTADDVGQRLASSSLKVVGERASQVENRARLKMAAYAFWEAVIDAALTRDAARARELAEQGQPRGTELVRLLPTNEHQMPNTIFFIGQADVREQTAKGGVAVRKRAK